MLPVLILWLFMQETSRYQVVRAEQRAGLRRRRFYGLGAIDRRDGRYIALSAAIWICWLVNSLLYFWGGYYFMTVRGFSFSQWNLVLLGTLLMAMTGGVAGGWLMDRVGRRAGLIVGCLGLAATLGIWGVVPRALLPVVAALAGFFISAAYTWIVVYVPEVFPTERRGACMGWTTTVARIAYVAGPALAAVLLQAFPTMEWFWVVAGAIMVLPVIIILLFNPYETKMKELEEIETRR